MYNYGVVPQYTDEELEKENEKIFKLTHYDIAKLMRNAPSGHPYFRSDLPFYQLLKSRFESFGGWNPALSKSIGWD